MRKNCQSRTYEKSTGISNERKKLFGAAVANIIMGRLDPDSGIDLIDGLIVAVTVNLTVLIVTFTFLCV